MPKIALVFLYCLHMTLKFIKTQENATSPAKPVIPFYWKTSDSTDHVLDYWNHGPVFIPGLQDRFTMTTKNPDIFPPWLTRTVPTDSPFPFINMTTIRRIMHKTTTEKSTTPETLTESIITGTTTTDKAFIIRVSFIPLPSESTDTAILTNKETTTDTPILTHKETMTTNMNINRTPSVFNDDVDLSKMTIATRFQVITDKAISVTPKVISNEHDKMANIKKQFKHKETAALKALLSSVALENFLVADPFSSFLHKFFRALSVKSLADLSVLVEAFLKHMTQLLVSGKLSVLGVETNFYLTKSVRDVNRAPDVLHKNVNQAYNTMGNRFAELAADVNELLDYMDEIYDEAEEEAMQEVLKLTTLFPGTSRSAEEIAQSFVNDIFLNPMQRVSGTFKGKIIFNMITNAVNKRISIERRFLENSQAYNFLKEPELVDEYVKFKIPRDDRTIFSNADIYEMKNHRRGLNLGNNKRKRASIMENSSNQDRNNGEKSYNSLKEHKTLRSIFLNEDITDGRGDSIESKVRNTSKDTENSKTQTDNHNSKMRMPPSQDSKYNKPYLSTTNYNSFENLRGAVKNSLNKQRKRITFASDKIMIQEGPYTRSHSEKTKNYNNKKHTILLPTDHIDTILKYYTQLYGDKYSKSRNVIKNLDKQEPITKPFSKLPTYDSHKALRNNPLPTSKKAKQNRAFHQQFKHGPPDKIKYTFSVNREPKLNNYKMATSTTKAYKKIINKLKAPYHSINPFKNYDKIKTIANSRNENITQDVADKETYSNAEDGLTNDSLYSDKSPFKSNEKQDLNQHIKQNLKRVTKLYNRLENKDKTLRDKPTATNNNFDKNNGLLHIHMKKVSQNMKNNKFSTNNPSDLHNVYEQINTKQMSKNTVTKTNKKYTKYNTKRNTKKSATSHVMIYSKNKTVTQYKVTNLEKRNLNPENEEIIYDDLDDDDSTSESVSSADPSLGDPDEFIVRKSTRLPGITQLRSTKLYSSANLRFRKNSKHKHHHKNRHKNSKHRKHRHKHLYYSKRKYDKLKRKYRKLKRLKDLIIAQRHLLAERGETRFQITTENTPHANQLIHTIVTENVVLEPPVINENIERAGVPNDYNYDNLNPEEFHDQEPMGMAPDAELDNINLFLKDYNANDDVRPMNADERPGVNGLPTSRHGGASDVPINSKRSRIMDHRKVQRKLNIKNTKMKSAQGRLKPTKNNEPIFKAAEYSNEELQLKQNLYDGLRHMDFDSKYFNVHRRSMIHGNSGEVLRDDSYETDLEAVLKRNIYKAVKESIKN